MFSRQRKRAVVILLPKFVDPSELSEDTADTFKDIRKDNADADLT